MRNLKKFLALILAFMMTFSLMVTVNASGFGDKEDINDDFAEAVNVLAGLKVIQGYEDGDFKPNKSITRGEVAAILYRIVTGDVKGNYLHLYKHDSEFTDVLATDWYAPYVNYCANNGLLKGVGNNRFNPNGNITGYETLVMILRAIGYNNPSEFTNSDWKFKASGYGAKLGLTQNISAGSLGGEASRETVSEIMFQGINAPMVNYSPLTMYTTDLLVDAAKVNSAYGINPDTGISRVIYASDVPNTLLYQTFGVVGYHNLYGIDNYGRPATLWLTDDADDTVENGGKYVPNWEGAAGVDATRGGKTPDASYADLDDVKLTIPEEPIKVYHDVVTECDLTKDVNGDKSIPAAKVAEYLNGAPVEARTNAIDMTHTQEGTIGAPGRTTEVYKLDGNQFVFVYIDTMLGVVTKVTKATYDTNNHVMFQATMDIKVNDTVTVTATSDTDYTDKVGDLVLLNTWGMTDTSANLNVIDLDELQHLVPAVEDDFKATNSKSVYGWAVDRVGKPDEETVTVKGTMGTKNLKTGIETDKGNKWANVVFLASGYDDDDVNNGFTSTGVHYYHTAATGSLPSSPGAATAFNGETTVPSTSPYNYGYRMANAAINKSYTIYKDKAGFVVGMTTAETGTDIGIVSGYEPVRISAGKWAVDVDMFMSDGTEKTVRMLAGSSTQNSFTAVTNAEPDYYIYFENMNQAETQFSAANLDIAKNVLVKIQAYTKDGATYYKPIETNQGLWQNYTGNHVADGNAVYTGRADTLTGVGSTQYGANPVTWDKSGNSLVSNPYNVDDDTQFIIAQVDWDYSLNEGNEGGYDDLELSVYTGFKNIPTVTGGSNDVMFQRIDNTVYVHPDALDNTLVYTVKSQPTYAVADTYLVYATGTTYQNYSVYKALKNGKPVDLNVSNNNLTLVNNKIEQAMVRGNGVALIVPTSTNARGHVTDVELLNQSAGSGDYNTQTILDTTTVQFDKHGVMYVDVAASNPTDKTDGTGVNFLTVDKDAQVVIVNLETGKYYEGTQDNIMQYENYTAGDSHPFVYELNQYGYISTIYIID